MTSLEGRLCLYPAGVQGLGGRVKDGEYLRVVGGVEGSEQGEREDALPNPPQSSPKQKFSQVQSRPAALST